MKNERVKARILLAGVPNVGKSTLFNCLTGNNVHTGNWSGKTVEGAVGYVYLDGAAVELVDLPGTYSLSDRSEEEKIAVRELLFSDSDAVIIVADASRLHSNLNFILRAAECKEKCVLALNLCDADTKSRINTEKLSSVLGIPVITVNAKKRSTLVPLIKSALDGEARGSAAVTPLGDALEKSIERIQKRLNKLDTPPYICRQAIIKALMGEEDVLLEYLKTHSEKIAGVASSAIEDECKLLFTKGYDADRIGDTVAERISLRSEEIYSDCIRRGDEQKRLSLADRILTGRLLAYPAMLLLLGVVLLATLKLAAYPSAALEYLFSRLLIHIKNAFYALGAAPWLVGIFCDGALSTLFTVVAVMLPPMAFFFPFFTLLEDSGYLPRVAYNLDRPFAACGACGKQALTMCMGLGCNAVGITGARIIESRRERLLAIITNSFVPCNGRFPILIVIIGTFFSGLGGVGAAAMLVLLILSSFLLTFLVTFLLSHTLLRGKSELFVLELPPYRMPDLGRVLVRSLFDRTLKVLARAAAVAFPMGAVIWLLSNVTLGGVTPVFALVESLDPLGRFMGLDGVMLTAFLLGLPANETVLPIALSLYGASGTVGEVLVSGGWTLSTAVCAAIFTLFHWPCSTSIITVFKETRSLFYTFLAVIIPTAVGFVLCALLSAILKFI